MNLLFADDDVMHKKSKHFFVQVLTVLFCDYVCLYLAWLAGVEVKSGQPLEVNLDAGKVLHLSQV